jgi:hypothetical protein
VVEDIAKLYAVAIAINLSETKNLLKFHPSKTDCIR